MNLGFWNCPLPAISELDSMRMLARGLGDARDCLTSPLLLGLYPGNLEEKDPWKLERQLLMPSFFSSSGKRRGQWSTSTGSDLRIWSSASPAPRHSQPWSVAPMATPIHPRSVFFIVFFFLVIKKYSVSACSDKALWAETGPCESWWT